MKVGDLVRIKERVDHIFTKENWKNPGWMRGQCGIATRIDDSHRQAKVDVLFVEGLKIGIWEGHLEVINESR